VKTAIPGPRSLELLKDLSDVQVKHFNILLLAVDTVTQFSANTQLNHFVYEVKSLSP